MRSVARIAKKRSIPMPRLMVRFRHTILSALGHKSILIYTMGKVGSSTAYQAIKNSGISKLTYHIHFLTQKNLERISQKYRKAGKSDTVVTIPQLLSGNLDHLSSSYGLATLPRVKKWYIISIVRDPVATFLSHVFQNPQVHRPFLIGNDGALSRSLVQEYIVDHYKHFDPANDYISNWFDNEFCKSTGINIYEYPFDAHAGCSLIDDKEFSVGIVSLEKIGKTLAPVLSKILKKKVFLNVVDTNVREKSIDGNLYRDIKAEVRISKNILTKVYATKYARHFFGEDDISQMINRWSEPRNING